MISASFSDVLAPDGKAGAGRFQGSSGSNAIDGIFGSLRVFDDSILAVPLRHPLLIVLTQSQGYRYCLRYLH